MVRITIDDALKQKLLESGCEVELCDTNGLVVARAVRLSKETDEINKLFPELTDEEIDHRCNSEGPWRTTEQVKDYLRNRP